MKKKILISALIIASIFCFMNHAFAKEVYYKNKNGVSFTKEEYDFLNLMFWNGSQDLFTFDDYNRFIESNIINGDIKVKFQNNIMPLATEINEPTQTLKISASCNSECIVTLTKTWKVIPSNLGYEVMGVRLDKVSLLNNPTVVVSSDKALVSINEKQIFDNGFGSSFLLNDDNSAIVVSEIFKTTKGGHIYESYQHATNYISLANSKKYTISYSGYGKVFAFSGIATSVYNRDTGVDIAV